MVWGFIYSHRSGDLHVLQWGLDACGCTNVLEEKLLPSITCVFPAENLSPALDWSLYAGRFSNLIRPQICWMSGEAWRSSNSCREIETLYGSMPNVLAACAESTPNMKKKRRLPTFVSVYIFLFWFVGTSLNFHSNKYFNSLIYLFKLRHTFVYCLQICAASKPFIVELLLYCIMLLTLELLWLGCGNTFVPCCVYSPMHLFGCFYSLYNWNFTWLCWIAVVIRSVPGRASHSPERPRASYNVNSPDCRQSAAWFGGTETPQITHVTWMFSQAHVGLCWYLQ